MLWATSQGLGRSEESAIAAITAHNNRNRPKEKKRSQKPEELADKTPLLNKWHSAVYSMAPVQKVPGDSSLLSPTSLEPPISDRI